ncbi:hypothetical protein GW17_00042838 [Ensete ventricosum]|nr:hypothetical protein GW17_00042838 [Ensete ventricosum]
MSSRPHLFLFALDEEKTAANKSLAREVLIRGAVLRFSGRRHLPLSRCNQVAARLIPPDSGQRRSKSTIIDLFRAVMGRKQPHIARYEAASRVSPGSERSMYQSAEGPVHIARLQNGRPCVYLLIYSVSKSRIAW